MSNGAEEGGSGEGHFVERHDFEGYCFRKLRSFYTEEVPGESEGRKDEQRSGNGCKP